MREPPNGPVSRRPVPADSGRVVYAGDALEPRVERRAKAQHRGLQLVFQDPVGALNPQMRVHGIIEESLLVHEPQWSRGERAVRVVEALDDRLAGGVRAGGGAVAPAGMPPD